MTQSSRCCFWKLGLASWLAMGGVITFLEDCALAQIAADGTLGAESSVVTPTNIDGRPTEKIDGGATRGANLFHSFEQFSVPTGSTAYFNSASAIQNIISRVTGGSISNIDGLIRANASANLFLLNPNGIIFGPNATLNIGGSFIGSTASRLNFADGSQFSAQAPQTTPLLTVSVPIGLQFGGNQGSIRNQSQATDSSGNTVGLQVEPGKTFALVGGDVILDGGSLQVPGGRVELGGVAGAGAVRLNFDGDNLGLSFSDGVQRADVSLNNGAFVDVTAGGGGSIALNSQNLDVLGGSSLNAGIGAGLGSVDSQAGDIALNATGVITISQSSRVLNQVDEDGSGNGGDINIKAGSLFITNNSGLETWGLGTPGNISVQANGFVSLAARSEFITSTFGRGDAGNISVQANDSVSLADSLFASVAYSRGTNAGNISVQANNSVSLRNSLVASRSGGVEVSESGNGGDIYIRGRFISVTEGAEVTTRTYGRGNAGNIEVNATDFVEISGRAPFPRPLNDYSQHVYYSTLLTSTEQTAFGSGGEISITTGTLRISNGANLNARSRSAARGGNITVNADVLEVTSGGQIITTAYSSGDAGNINVNGTDRINISGSNPTLRTLANQVAENLDEELAEDTIISVEPASGIFANTTEESTSSGGDLRISTGQLNIRDRAQVSVSSAGVGAAGALTVGADSVGLDNQGSIQATTGAGNQGNITLRSPILLLRRESDITTNATGTATGGNITLDTDILTALENSDITANAGEGQGGNVQINTQGLFVSPDSQITASSERGIDGVVEINTPDVDPSQGLANLPAQLVEASGLIATGCAALGENEFIVTGRGGLPENPSDPLSSDAVQVDLVTLNPREENGSSPTVSTNPTAPAPLVEAQGWEINNKGEVVLTATAPNNTLNIPWLPSPTCHTP